MERMMITFEKIGRSGLRGEEQLTGPRADTPRGSMPLYIPGNSSLPHGKIAQALLDVGCFIGLSLFVISVALSFPLAIGILIFL
jgi:hypothetical protein